MRIYNKRILLSVLALLCLLSLCACGGESSGESNKDYFYNESNVSGIDALIQPEKPLDPKQLYASVTYTPLCSAASMPTATPSSMA